VEKVKRTVHEKEFWRSALMIQKPWFKKDMFLEAMAAKNR